MYKLIFFVPESHLEKVKEALFFAGLGEDAQYSHTCWQTAGQMQFIPKPGSHPARGQIGQIYFSQDYRVEMICKKKLLRKAVKILVNVHPYDQPAYEIYKVEQLDSLEESKEN